MFDIWRNLRVSGKDKSLGWWDGVSLPLVTWMKTATDCPMINSYIPTVSFKIVSSTLKQSKGSSHQRSCNKVIVQACRTHYDIFGDCSCGGNQNGYYKQGDGQSLNSWSDMTALRGQFIDPGIDPRRKGLGVRWLLSTWFWRALSVPRSNILEKAERG